MFNYSKSQVNRLLFKNMRVGDVLRLGDTGTVVLKGKGSTSYGNAFNIETMYCAWIDGEREVEYLGHLDIKTDVL